jgi:branched-subunit amino acid transport protein
MSVWLVIIATGVLTFATRLSFIAVLDRYPIPDRLRQALRFVPIAVLTAIIVPELTMQHGTLALSLLNPRLLAGTLAVVVALVTRNALLTIAVGMGALWFFLYLFDMVLRLHPGS